MTERQKGIQVHRPIIYGSHARLLSDAERQLAPPGHTHRWTIFLTSATSPPPKAGEAEDMDYLPGGGDDLSYLIKKVTFRLHETYPNPSRVCDKPPFKVTETGWGEFTVQIRIQFIPESGEKPLNLAHPIKLHHWGAPVDGSAPAPSAPVTAAPTPAAEEKGSVSSPKPGNAAASSTADGEAEGEIKAERVGSTPAEQPTPSTSTAAGTPAGAAGADTTHDNEMITAVAPSTNTNGANLTNSDANNQQPLSIAAKYPVHAWQYDEIIFSDPPLNFLNILNENPPTPLPPRNRRPRDQRDIATKSKKLKGGRQSTASIAGSRQGTVEPATGGLEGSAPPPAGVPAPGQGIGVGIPGEPGSADVPLEFTMEMEKGEWNRLHGARKKIIEEMDRWRSKLIEDERELAKLKEEMRTAAAA